MGQHLWSKRQGGTPALSCLPTCACTQALGPARTVQNGVVVVAEQQSLTLSPSTSRTSRQFVIGTSASELGMHGLAAWAVWCTGRKKGSYSYFLCRPAVTPGQQCRQGHVQGGGGMAGAAGECKRGVGAATARPAGVAGGIPRRASAPSSAAVHMLLVLLFTTFQPPLGYTCWSCK